MHTDTTIATPEICDQAAGPLKLHIAGAESHRQEWYDGSLTFACPFEYGGYFAAADEVWHGEQPASSEILPQILSAWYAWNQYHQWKDIQHIWTIHNIGFGEVSHMFAEYLWGP